MNLATLANESIPKGNNVDEVFYQNGDTEDIIRTVLYADARGWMYTQEFAKKLEGGSWLQTASNTWNFLKKNIHYIEDGFYKQRIKSPAQFWTDKSGDCKSFSVFTASVLRNLSIPYVYRFVSFSPDSPKVTHVYIAIPAQNGNKEIIIDCVWHSFNSQKPFSSKREFPMTEISYVHGIGSDDESTNVSGQQRKRGMLNLGDPNKLDDLREGEMDLHILRQRAEIMTDIMHGIGNVKHAERWKDVIDVANDMLNHYHDKAKVGAIVMAVDRGDYSIGKQVHHILTERKRFMERLKLVKQRDAKVFGKMKSTKIADITARLKKHQYALAQIEARLKGTVTGTDDIEGLKEMVAFQRSKQAAHSKERLAQLKTWHERKIKILNNYLNDMNAIGDTGHELDHHEIGSFFGKILKGVGKGIKAVAKAVVKVATLPLRLTAKAILEVMLPKSAPSFLYLFITDPKVLAKQPAVVQKKRKKSEKLANFIVNAIGMKRAHFMGIVRNGILKRYKAQPEAVIAAAMKGKISGVGALPVLLLIKPLLWIIGKIGALFKKKLPEEDQPKAEDMPDPQGDYASIVNSGQATALAAEVINQAPSSFTPSGGGGYSASSFGGGSPGDLPADGSGGDAQSAPAEGGEQSSAMPEGGPITADDSMRAASDAGWCNW